MSLSHSRSIITTAKVLFMQPRSLILHTSKHYAVSKPSTFSDSPTSHAFTFTLLLNNQSPRLSSAFFSALPAVVVPTVNGCAANFCVAALSQTLHRHQYLCFCLSAFRTVSYCIALTSTTSIFQLTPNSKTTDVTLLRKLKLQAGSKCYYSKNKVPK